MGAFLGSLRNRMRDLSSKYTAEELALIDSFIKSAIVISREETLRLRGAGEGAGAEPGTAELGT
jgi:hypothetical protein